jgi:hypothetical protein
MRSWHTLVEPPAPSHGALPAPELLFQLRGVFDDPAVERGMIHGDPPLPHHLLELPIRNRIGHIPPDAPQDDVPLKLESTKKSGRWMLFSRLNI